ncbi:MAG TPA: hypothetical protein PK866_01710 [Nitrospira sp.]|nr:hypothetical protein [Nitrospira sp.]
MLCSRRLLNASPEQAVTLKYSVEALVDRCGIFAAIGQECLKNRWAMEYLRIMSGRALGGVWSSFFSLRRRLDGRLIDTLP